MRSLRFILGAIIVLAAASGFADEPAKPTSIKVTGSVTQPGEWTVESIVKEFAGDVKEITFKTKDGTAKARVVPLLKLVNHAKPKVDEKAHHPELAFCIVVKGTDGYAATFSMGELLPEIGAAEVYVGLDRDGKPLPEKQQPMSLLVVSDKKGSRHVHGIATVTVVDAATTQNLITK